MTKFPPKSAVFAAILIATQTILTPATSLFGSQVQAQTVRNFPVSAVRGTIAFKTPPEIVVDNKAERLSPGARIRDTQNMMAMTGALAGKEFVVNYRRESTSGLVSDVWLLSADEAAVKREGAAK
jgi:hypothetical protein